MAAPTPPYTAWQSAPGRVPEGRRVYAIGDVHGCLDQLVAMHWAIAGDLAADPVRESVLVHIGDYVDRGPASAQVLWLLAGSIAAPVGRRVDLKGNHEAMMLGALAGDLHAASHWLDNGGEATLASYGLTGPASVRPELWREKVPGEHVAWMEQLYLTHREGDYFFVHAGIRPGISLRAQAPHDLMWIREPFLSDRSRREVVVVHGHTPRDEPEIFENRIGIDTGAVMGGVLTCVVLQADRMRFIQR